MLRRFPHPSGSTACGWGLRGGGVRPAGWTLCALAALNGAFIAPAEAAAGTRQESRAASGQADSTSVKAGELELAIRQGIGNTDRLRQAFDDLLIAPPEAMSEAITRLLASTSSSADEMVVTATLNGLARRSWVSGAALGPLREAMNRVPLDRRGPYYTAISSIRTTGAARLLLAEAQARLSQSTNGNGGGSGLSTSDEAIRALVRLTGRGDLGANLDQWQRWFDSAAASDHAWSEALLRGLAGAADTEARNSDRSQQRLLEFLRQSYLALETPEQRSAMLTRLIGDDLAAVRKLSLQTVMQELANGRSPDQALTEAIVARISDPTQEVRTLAAELLNRLPVQAEHVGVILNRVLQDEQDPAVAARLLPAAARWPSASSLPVVRQWLGSTSPAREAAAAAMLAYLEGGFLEDPSNRTDVTTTLRGAELASLGSSGLRLLVTLGTDADRDSVRRLLTSATPAARLRAAEALLSDPGSVTALLDAAERDPALYSFAAQAVRNAGPTRETYLEVRRLPLPPGTSEATARRLEPLIVLASMLPARDLLAVATQEHDPEFREALLSRVTLAGLSPVPGPFGVMPAPDLKPAADSLLLLAETRLDLRQPAAAMSALAALGPVAAAVDELRLGKARCRVFVAMDRLDEARALNASADDWLGALEENLTLPHAASVVDIIDAHFGASLNAAQTARLADLRRRLPTSPPELMGPPASGQRSSDTDAAQRVGM